MEGDAQLVDWREESAVAVNGFSFLRFLLLGFERGFNKMLPTFSRRRGGNGVNDLVFLNQACGDAREKRAIIPEIYADVVSVRSCQELACIREGERGAGTLHSECIDQMACW